MLSLLLLVGANGGASAQKLPRPAKPLMPNPVERPFVVDDEASAPGLALPPRPIAAAPLGLAGQKLADLDREREAPAAPQFVRIDRPVAAPAAGTEENRFAETNRKPEIAAVPRLRPNDRDAAEPAVGLSERLLAVHNRERDLTGVPRLAWSDRLEREAQAWAERLAREGTLRHASEAESGGAGENLWMGTAGYFAPERMVHAFVAERRHYTHGKFPDVSRTGKWQDVGHYTQLVWRDTREVGCAVVRGAGNDILVCRYRPAGNWMGELPF